MDRQIQLSPDILRTFVAAARTSNFTHAAHQLHRTQSAVSMQINRLEGDLGKVLFRRITRGVELTADGEALLKYARRLLRLHDEALASLTQPDVAGRIRLGAAEDYASQHLTDILRRFGRRYPLVRVDLYCDHSKNLLRLLQRGEIDICLCNSEHGETGGRFLRYEPVVWVAPVGVVVEKERPLPLAVFHHGCIYRKWALQALTEQEITYRIAYSSPSTAGVLAAVKAGLAVAPVGASIPRSGLRLLGEGMLNKLPSAVVSLHQADKPASQAQALLAEYISDAFRNMPMERVWTQRQTTSA
ncbi:MAG: LysR substrate-binding domain-containing protein [Desulfosarcinaceae bacterium]|nr:LysR substrate-binding domain-containing protein [Desulfosarcinaceae bacterium]